MPPPDPAADDFEALLADCIDQVQSRGPTALDSACAAHPEHADRLRRQMASLERAGLVEPATLASTGETFPERLGDFRLIHELGAGGMGVVYRAQDETLEREVALKLIRPEQLFFTGARERFRREVQIVAGLQHPGIVPVYQVGEESGVPYFAMELVHGASLDDVLQRLAGRDPARLRGSDLASALAQRLAPTAEPEPQPAGAAVQQGAQAPLSSAVETTAPLFRGSWVEACLRLVRDAAEAADYAHSQGVLHRDIKPSNLMLTADGRVRLVDFGVSSNEAHERITQAGSQVGSLLYMAPECVRGEPADARADVYSFGVTLYELLALEAPYHAKTAVDVHAQILAGKPPALRDRNPRVTRDAETVCLKALDRDPARRYPSMLEFARDLERVLAFEPIAARRAGPLLRARRWSQRHPAGAVSLVLGSLLLIGMPSLLLLQERRSNAALAQTNSDLDRANARLRETLESEANERQRAEGNLDRALDSVDVMLSGVARELHDVPRLEGARRLLLDEAVKLTEELERQGPLERGQQLQLANLYITRGRVLALLGERGADFESMQRSLEYFDQVRRLGPFDLEATLQHAESLFTLGQELADRDRNEDARSMLARSADLYAEALEAEPSHADARAGLLHALNERSQVIFVLGDRAEGLRIAEEVLATARKHIDPDGLDSDGKLQLGSYYLAVARLYHGETRRAEALGPYAEAYALMRSALDEAPNSLEVRRRLLGMAGNYGRLLGELGQIEASAGVLRFGLDVARRLVDEFPGAVEYARLRASFLQSLGTTLARTGDWETADPLFEEAFEVLGGLTERFPGDASMHSGLGDALANWAASFHVRGELGRAREFVERAIVAHGEAIRRTSVAAGMGYGWRLGRTRLIHAAILVQMGEPEAAAETVEAALEDCGEDPQALHEAAGVLALCASAASEPPLADDYTQRAVDLLQSALDLGLSTLRLDAPTLQALRSHPRFAALRAGSQ